MTDLSLSINKTWTKKDVVEYFDKMTILRGIIKSKIDHSFVQQQVAVRQSYTKFQVLH